MTNPYTGVWPNSVYPSPMNIINPDPGWGDPTNLGVPMNLIKTQWAWDRTQSFCLLMNNNELGLDSSMLCS